MNASGLSLSGQSFSFSYFLQYVQSFSFSFSFDSRFDVEIIIIKNKINNFKTAVADLLPRTPG
tara:strand:- start:1058 stop:1246 length:189 start_codon:yes stop_codon:yes gene_type:complete